ncbi:MAG: 50S ribosomal protein L11 [Candidatus Bilamarchaeaceae archaeon]
MEKIINAIVDGGRATAGPPLGPALGPLGVNTGQVIAEINNATKAFIGMKVPVKVIVDTETKKFRVEVGTPPTVELLKKAAGVEKGASNREAAAGNVPLSEIIKIAKSKTNSLGKNLKNTVKEICGSCLSSGITIDGKNAKEIIKEIDMGKHDSLFAG